MRYLTSVFVSKFWTNQFPLATFITNGIGCFLIGFIVGILTRHQLEGSNLKWLLATGFCGGFTTFSAFGIENISLLQNNHSYLAFMYIGLSILLGISGVWLGLFLSK